MCRQKKLSQQGGHSTAPRKPSKNALVDEGTQGVIMCSHTAELIWRFQALLANGKRTESSHPGLAQRSRVVGLQGRGPDLMPRGQTHKTPRHMRVHAVAKTLKLEQSFEVAPKSRALAATSSSRHERTSMEAEGPKTGKVGEGSDLRDEPKQARGRILQAPQHTMRRAGMNDTRAKTVEDICALNTGGVAVTQLRQAQRMEE